MNAIVEIDAAGRIVVPKKMRDALHLVPGTRIAIHQQGENIVLGTETKPRGLIFKDGIPVYDAGPLPPLEDRDWVEEARTARMEEILGPGLESGTRR